MRKRGIAAGALVALGLACASGTNQDALDRAEVLRLKREMSQAEELALSAAPGDEQRYWLQMYDERRNALNQVYAERALRLGETGRSTTPAACTSRVVDDMIESICN